MTTYVPDPVVVTLAYGQPTEILKTDDDLSNYHIEVTFYCNKRTIFNVQYDMDGTGAMWVTQDKQDLTDTNKTFRYPGRGKTRILATNLSDISETEVSCKIISTAFRGYCSIDDVRAMSSLTTDDITDANVYTLIRYATAQVNKDINVRRIEEKVEGIDQTRQNKIDGSNATYYVQNSFYWYLADYNNDGQVTTADVTVYSYAGDGTRTELTVSSINENGKIILSSAPNSSTTNRMTITHSICPVSEYTPDTLVKQACSSLVSAMAYTGIEPQDFQKIELNRLKVMRMPTIGYDYYMRQYQNIIHQIKTRDFMKQEGVETSSELRPVKYDGRGPWQITKQYRLRGEY